MLARRALSLAISSLESFSEEPADEKREERKPPNPPPPLLLLGLFGFSAELPCPIVPNKKEGKNNEDGQIETKQQVEKRFFLAQTPGRQAFLYCLSAGFDHIFRNWVQ